MSARQLRASSSGPWTRVGPALFGAAALQGVIRFDDAANDASADSAKPVWVQVARTGTWMGHPRHPQGVTFTKAMFEQVVSNLHSHPWYKAGADGVGMTRVIPYDYEHASELDPTLGSIPQDGAGAPAWVTEFQLRAGDGETSELWALTLFGTKAREQVRAKEYLSTSVALFPKAKSAVTGQDIGAIVTSIALTNHPFIQGMEPIAASRPRGPFSMNVSVWGEAESIEQAVVGMRDIFGLPAAAPVAEIVAQFARLKEILAAPQPAEGDAGAGELEELRDQAESIACRLRELLALPTLSTLDEVIARGGQLLAAMTLTPTTTPAVPGDTPTMSTSKLNDRLCTLLRLQPGSSDEVILAAAETQAESNGVLGQLISLFESDGTKELLTKAKDAIAQADKAKGYLSALSAANERVGEVDAKEAEAEVQAVAASLGMDRATYDWFGPLLLRDRMECCYTIDAAGVTSPRTKEDREARLALFRQRYPVQSPEAARLSSTMLAGPHGAQFGGPATGLGGVRMAMGGGGAAPGFAPLPAAPSPGQEHPAEGYEGRNRIEKTVAYLCDKRLGFKAKHRQDQIREAGEYLAKGAPILT